MRSNLFILVQIGLFAFTCFAIYFIIRQKRITKYEQRFAQFSLNSSYESKFSMFDFFKDIFFQIVHIISKLLKKSKLITKHSKKFQKYLLGNEKEYKSSLDFLSIKFLNALLFLIIYLVIPKNNWYLAIFLSPIMFLIGYMLPNFIYQYIYIKRVKQIRNDLLEAISLLQYYLTKNKSIFNSFELTIRQLHGLIKEEFQIIHRDLLYGLTIKEAFTRFYERVRLTQVKEIVYSLSVLTKDNSNASYIFKNIKQSLLEQKQLAHELSYYHHISLILYRLFLLLPLILIFTIYLVYPTYFNIYLTTFMGKLLLIFLFLIYLLYYQIIKSILGVNNEKI